MDGSLRANSPQTANVLDKFYNRMNDAATAKTATTGGSLNDTIKQLHTISRKNPTNFEGVAAAQARDGLTDLFHNATPISAPPGYDPVTALANAKLANAQFKDAAALEGWQREINKYGGNVGAPVKAYNEQWYGGDNTPQDDALMRIYQTQRQSGAVPRWATALAHEAIGAGIGETAGHMMGVPPGLGAAGGAALTYGVAKPILGAVRGVNQGINTQQAFDQAYPAMTGRSLTPVDTAAFADALRRLGITYGGIDR